MTTSTLRGLAKAYSENLIDRKQYIRERRQLIDGIVSGDTAIVPYEPAPATIKPPNERTFSDGETTIEIPRVETEAATVPATPAPAPAPAREAAPVPRRSRWPVIVIAGIAVLAGGVAYWWRTQAPPVPAFENPPPIAPPQDMTATTRAETLLREFLDANQWQPARIDAFIAEWRALPPAALRKVADSPQRRRAGDKITQKIVEENAMLEIGERADALETQRRLLDLAAVLSLDNDRIRRYEAAWTENRAALLLDQQQAAATVAVVPQIQTVADNTVNTVATRAPVRKTDPPAEPSVTPPTAAASASAPAAPANSAANAVATTPAAPAEPPSIVSAPPPTMANAVTAAAVAPAAAVQTAAVAAAQSAPSNAENSSAKPAKKTRTCTAALAKQRRPYCRDALSGNARGPLLVVLPPGQVEVGGREAEEQPRRVVNLARAIGLGMYEVSVAEFRLFCTATERTCPPQPWSDASLPVVNVTWALANEYTRWLSAETQANYRLPSEAEWEYAARAGTKSPYPFGDEILPTHARFSFRGEETMPLPAADRTVNRNRFRLYHMVGNVREWVLDSWFADHAGAPRDGSARTGGASLRVARGGAYSDGADGVRSASRVPLDAQVADAYTGFRVLRELGEE